MSSPKKYSLWLVTKAYSILIGTALLSLSLILGHSFLSQKDIESISLHLAVPQIAPTARALPFECPNSWPLRRALLIYDGPNVRPADSMLDYIAQRFEYSIEEGNPYILGALKQRNPNFFTLQYQSLSDSYAPPAAVQFLPEYNWFQTHASEYGADPEDTFLHFWSDTEVRLEGQNLIIPGWQPDSPKPGASATSRSEARIPVYWSNLIRRAVNFSTPQIRAAHHAYHVYLLQQPIATNLYWNGFFFDNTAYYSLQVSIVTSGSYPNGGLVAEHPTHTILNTPTFIDWYWFQGIIPFVQELRQWVDTNPPELNGRRVMLQANVANVPNIASSDWERAYINVRSADSLFQEFEFNPTRDGAPLAIFQKNKLAQQAGIELFQPGLSVTTRPPYLGSYTTDEALMNTLGLHWVMRTPNVLILGHQANGILNTDWAQNMKGIFDLDLGQAVEDPHVIQTGTDPHGYAYTVYGRQFSCGYAIVRGRGLWNQDIGGPSDGTANTAVTVTLPNTYIPVNSDGLSLTATSTWNLRNGQAQIFLSSSVTPPPLCIESWSCTAWSSCTNNSQSRTCTDSNNCGTTTNRPPLTQSCTAACSPEGSSRACTTTEACPGTQSCNNGNWNSCTDIPSDGCPALAGTLVFQNGLNGYTGTTEAGIAGPAVGENNTYSFDSIRKITNWTRKNVIKFDLSSIPIGSLVEEAKLSLYQNFLNSVASNVTVYRLLKSWVRPGVTWRYTNDTNQNGCVRPELAW